MQQSDFISRSRNCRGWSIREPQKPLIRTGFSRSDLPRATKNDLQELFKLNKQPPITAFDRLSCCAIQLELEKENNRLEILPSTIKSIAITPRFSADDSW